VSDAAVPRRWGPAYAHTLWRLWRAEQHDPEPFYRYLAAEAAADLDRRHGPLRGQTIVDLGCGPGWYTRALRDRGATVIPVDNDPAELALPGGPPEGAGRRRRRPAGRARERRPRLLLEPARAHARVGAGDRRDRARPAARRLGLHLVDELVLPVGRARHEPVPLPRAAGRAAPVRAPPRPAAQDPYGAGLWARRIGTTLREVRARPGLRIERAEPRYWPQLRAVCRVPGLRELVTWNCVIRVRRV
jgi:hypothetical protein